MKILLLFFVAFMPCLAWSHTDVVFFDYAQFVTEPGAFNGYDISRLHPEHVSFGPGINLQHGYMLADDFTLETAATITELEVYAYISYSPTTQGQVCIEDEDMQHIKVMNIVGQMLFDIPVSGNRFELDLGQLRSGSYIVSVVTKTGIGTKHLTVVQ